MFEIRKSRAVSILSRLKMLYTLVRSQYNLFANHVTERSCLRSSCSISFPMCIIVNNKKGGTIHSLFSIWGTAKHLVHE